MGTVVEKSSKDLVNIDKIHLKLINKRVQFTNLSNNFFISLITR